jgi:hypothetical protein
MMHLKLDSSFPTVPFLSPAYLPQFLCLAQKSGVCIRGGEKMDFILGALLFAAQSAIA